MATRGENFVILACTVLIQITRVTDGRTDASTMAKTREILHVVACKNGDQCRVGPLFCRQEAILRTISRNDHEPRLLKCGPFEMVDPNCPVGHMTREGLYAFLFV